jgi:hypothetical protein
MSVFGGETFGKDTRKESMMAAAGSKLKDADGKTPPHVRNPLAGDVEELAPQAERSMDLDVKGDSRMMTEYSDLIEAYFKRLAEGQ